MRVLRLPGLTGFVEHLNCSMVISGEGAWKGEIGAKGVIVESWGTHVKHELKLTEHETR